MHNNTWPIRHAEVLRPPAPFPLHFIAGLHLLMSLLRSLAMPYCGRNQPNQSFLLSFPDRPIRVHGRAVRGQPARKGRRGRRRPSIGSCKRWCCAGQGPRGARPLSRRRHRLRPDQGRLRAGRHAGRPMLVPIGKLAANPLRVERASRRSTTASGGLIEQKVKFPIWLDPLAAGQTPMCQALDLAWNSLNDFLGAYPDCFPPIVINITDGKATDGDPESHARCLRDLAATTATCCCSTSTSLRGATRQSSCPTLKTTCLTIFARVLSAFRASCRRDPRNGQARGLPWSTSRRGALCSTPIWFR